MAGVCVAIDWEHPLQALERDVLPEALIGVSIDGDDTILGATGARIISNVVDHQISIGVTVSSGHRDFEVAENLISDCNINIRPHDLNDVPADGRRVLIHHNRLWLPGAVGKHFHLHWTTAPPPPQPDLWVYGNSLSGGPYGFYFNAYADEAGGLPGGGSSTTSSTSRSRCTCRPLSARPRGWSTSWTTTCSRA